MVSLPPTFVQIYSLDDAECSELCFCGDTLVLTCHALCVPFTPCRTSLAFYSHASPAFQAFRGRCLCYSGNFICMRPQPGEYVLPGGIYLLLGYSSIDEELLRAYTNLGIQDTVRAFQQYLHNHIDNQVFIHTPLTLTQQLTYSFSSADILHIASVQYHRWKYHNYRQTSTHKRFKSTRTDWAEKGESQLPHWNTESTINFFWILFSLQTGCKDVLEKISYEINSQNSDLAAHQLLSIYKMAEVLIVTPEVNRSSSMACISFTLLLSLVTVSVSTQHLRQFI